MSTGRRILGPPQPIQQPTAQLPDGDPRNYNDDPLGISAMDRERQRDRLTELTNRGLAQQNGQLVSFSNLGPLPDYRWRAMTGALHDNADVVAGGSLPQSRFNEMTPFYNNQFGGDVSNHYDTGMAPQAGGSLARMQGVAKAALHSMKRKR